MFEWGQEWFILEIPHRSKWGRSQTGAHNMITTQITDKWYQLQRKRPQTPQPPSQQCRQLQLTQRKTTDQNYVPRKWKNLKPAMKWRVPDQTTSKSNTFSFSSKTTTPVSTQATDTLFVFGVDTQKLKVSETSRSSKNIDETWNRDWLSIWAR